MRLGAGGRVPDPHRPVVPGRGQPAAVRGHRQCVDPATGAETHALLGHTGRVDALAVAPDGGWLASAGDDGSVRLWDPATGAETHALLGHTGRVDALAVAPDGGWLASAGDDGSVRLWDPATNRVAIASLRFDGALNSLCAAGRALAASGDHGPYWLRPKHLQE